MTNSSKIGSFFVALSRTKMTEYSSYVAVKKFLPLFYASNSRLLNLSMMIGGFYLFSTLIGVLILFLLGT